MHSTDKRLLGDISPAQFMRRHWQKSPRLIRQAIPGFNGIIDRKSLFALAARDDVESRLVIRTGGKRGWTLEHGPFRAADFKSLPASNWPASLRLRPTQPEPVPSWVRTVQV